MECIINVHVSLFKIAVGGLDTWDVRCSRSFGTACSCFYLLLALVLITTRQLTLSSKASDIVTSSLVSSGWGGGFAEISDLPRDKSPPVCGTNIYWIVSYVSELWTYLTFLWGAWTYFSHSFYKTTRVFVGQSLTDKVKSCHHNDQNILGQTVILLFSSYSLFYEDASYVLGFFFGWFKNIWLPNLLCQY